MILPACPMHAAFMVIAERGYGSAWKFLSGLQGWLQLFCANVNYFTFDPASPGQDAIHRTA
jgi:hypothetical protein